MSDLDDEWLDKLDKEEMEYDIFYKDISDIVKIYHIYINKDKKIYHIKKNKLDLDDNILPKENLIFLLKKNRVYNSINHTIISILQYNIDLKPQDINKYLKNPNNFNFLTINSNIDDIKWEDSINLFKDINTLYIIYYEKENKPKKQTKKIYIKQKLKRKKTKKNYLKRATLDKTL